MGTYLSSPIVEKGTEEGACLEDPVTPLSWGVVDMQGWRKSMEDAHVASTDVAIPHHLNFDDGGGAHDPRTKAKVFGVFDGHGGAEVARFCQLYLVDVLTKQEAWKEETPEEDNGDPVATPVGQALIHAFHALDRMIDDRSRRDELIRLRSNKPKYEERRTTDSIPPEAKAVQQFVEPVKAVVTEDIGEQQKTTEEEGKTTRTEEQVTPDTKPDESDTTESTESTTTVEKEEATPEDQPEEENTDDDSAQDEDSTEVVGTDNVPEEPDNVVADVEPTPAVAPTPAPTPAPAPAPTPAPAPVLGMVATIIQNGRQICNLPDHPIHAGCTAIVAVLIGRTLTIANAGDSRAVLCRVGGRTEALSFDHKPHQDREMSRITKAGGFVNQFGRVNGNLNLSRSIGDLKYKQIPGLTPAEQMITAEPDIIQVTLHPKDEFIVLGCDGIWDCLSNDQAVKYVRDRIETKNPIEIGIEMLDEIISEDPRATQGIGGDNMTIMVIDLQPSKRAYR